MAMPKPIERRYKELEKRYAQLKKEYLKIRKISNHVILTVGTELPRHAVLIVFGIISIIGVMEYKSPIIIEFGIIAAVADLVYELYGTKKGWWKYGKSRFMIAGRVPVNVPLTYFFMGMAAVIFVLIRLSI